MTTMDTFTTYDRDGRLEKHRADVAFQARDSAVIAEMPWTDAVAAAVGEASKSLPRGWKARHWEGFNLGPLFFLECWKFAR